MITTHTREMWEASRWNNDSTYHTPMVTCNGVHIFAGDLVEFYTLEDGVEYSGCAKVMSFYVDDEVHVNVRCQYT